MKKNFVLVFLLFCSVLSTGQETGDDYPSNPSRNRKTGSGTISNEDYPAYTSAKRNLKKFNYFYLRLSYPFPSSEFGNPMIRNFSGNHLFTSKDRLRHQFRAGLELG